LEAIRRAQVIDLCVQGELAVCILSHSQSPYLVSIHRTLLIVSETTDAEALQVTYDPTQITYRQLIEFFYKMHDPTTSNRQGPDTGSQYRSGIFYHDAQQEEIAREVTKQANEKWWKGKIVTEILPAGEWWDAEDYHQKYLDNNPG
jgi:peptide-methionine (S)-S-oxide reductase